MNSIHNAHVEQTSFVMSSHQIKQNKKKTTNQSHTHQIYYYYLQ